MSARASKRQAATNAFAPLRDSEHEAVSTHKQSPKADFHAVPFPGTGKEAGAAILRLFPKASDATRYVYKSRCGELLGAVIRTDLTGGKKNFTSIFHGYVGDESPAWAMRAPTRDRPLYRLSKVVEASTLIVHEGEKCTDLAAAEIDGNGLVSTTSMAGAHSVEHSDLSPVAGKKVIIFRDGNEAGKTYRDAWARGALAAGATSVRVAEPPDDLSPEDRDKWDYAWARENGWTVDQLHQMIEEAPPWTDPDWPELEPLPGGLPPVPEFDPELLPASLRAWISDIAERMQCPPEYPAAAALVAMGSLIGRALAIRPKRNDDWTVIPNLWGGVVGSPGTLKSPAVREVMSLLNVLEGEAAEAYEEALKDWEADKIVAKETASSAKARMKEALEANDGAKAKDAARNIHDAETPPKPNGRRYLVSDTTTEKLGEILQASPRGVLIYRDELPGWFHSLDRSGREQDRAFHLEGWAGDNAFTFDRIGRGTVRIKSLCVSIFGTIQPGPLRAYLRAADEGGRGDDGLLQRFQVLVYPDRPEIWQNVDRKPDLNARNAATAVFRRLASDDIGSIGKPSERAGDPPYLRFSTEAQELFTEWRYELEAEIASGTLPAFLEAHFSKYRSLAPSLALAFHLADGGEGPVDAESLGRALDWCDLLRAHAERVYDTLARRDVASGLALAARIKAGDVPQSFTVRWLYRKGWADLKDPNDAKEGIAMLVDLGWLRENSLKTGGRSSPAVQVNPTLLGESGHEVA